MNLLQVLCLKQVGSEWTGCHHQEQENQALSDTAESWEHLKGCLFSNSLRTQPVDKHNAEGHRGRV